ncbi:MAG: hypothetical protein ACREXY_29425, partial [Gammaproteobacteria bacterium]
GTLADQASEIMLRRRQGFEGLIAAVGSWGDALLAPVSSTGKYESLCLTKRQRDEAIANVRSTFGSNLNVGSNGRYSSDYAAAAVTFVQFLEQAWTFQRGGT